jgi:AcrR family transcriptional regulator
VVASGKKLEQWPVRSRAKLTEPLLKQSLDRPSEQTQQPVAIASNPSYKSNQTLRLDAEPRKTGRPGARARTGGRSARVVESVLAAALEVFAERGYGGLSIEEVASRAGVNKTTVYRRWPTKVALVDAALRDLKAHDEPPPDTGDLREDLFITLRAKADQMMNPRGRSVRRAVLAGESEPELRAVVLQLRKEYPVVPRIVLERAVSRGELPEGTDYELVTTTLVGSLFSNTLWRERVEDDLLRRLIDLVVSGARAMNK